MNKFSLTMLAAVMLLAFPAAAQISIDRVQPRSERVDFADSIRTQQVERDAFSLAKYRAERAAREDLARRGGVDLQDKIMRAYGILCNACKVATNEFMELIAYVKLGIALDFIKADADKADELITLTQPAMLCKAAGKKLNAEERDITRARIVRNALAR